MHALQRNDTIRYGANETSKNGGIHDSAVQKWVEFDPGLG